MLHAILADLVEHGADVFVNVDAGQNLSPYRLDGVTVIGNRPHELRAMALEADVLVTHLDRTAFAVAAAVATGRPLVHLVHNDRQLQFHAVRPVDGTLIVPNSAWLSEALRWPGDELIVRPPVWVADYEVPELEHRRDAITLINLTEPKGANVFYELAQTMLDRSFLGVVGAYGTQDTRHRRRPSNVELLEHSAAIRDDVYARTAVLLMPSSYESWGRVAIEAAASGIPTIANPTPGLLEALGDAGIFVDLRDVAGYERELRRLQDPDAYAEASARSRARALELDKASRLELAVFRSRLEELVRTHPPPTAYDPTMPGILNLARAGVVCPICAASSCACQPSAAVVLGGLEVNANPVIINRNDRLVGSTKRYRTHGGDFALDDVEARARGFLPDGEELPRPVVLRLAPVADELDGQALTDAYRAASFEARVEVLTAIALTGPRFLAQEAPAWLEVLSAHPGPPKASTASREASGPKPAGTRIGEVLAWAGQDAERLQAALEAERDGKARPTLITELERRLEEA